MIRLALAIILAVTMLANPAVVSELAAASFQGKRGVGGIRTFGFPIAQDAAAGTFAEQPYRPSWREEMLRGRLAELKAAGFDFIRLNIDPGPLLASGEAARGRLIGEIEEAVTTTLAAGLAVLVDLHPPGSHPLWGAARLTSGAETDRFASYLDLVRRMARLVADQDPQRVALELFNEPPPPCRWTGRTPWPELLARLHGEARRAAPRHTLVVAGACYAGIDGLVLLDGQSFDANTVFTFHYYAPFVFSHQGFWAASDIFVRHAAPLPYPPAAALLAPTLAQLRLRLDQAKELTPASRQAEWSKARRRVEAYFAEAGPATIDAHFREVTAWAVRHGIAPSRILLGEFGAMKDVYGYKGADPADRARWLADVRTAAERHGFAWSVWALTNTMGIVTGDLGGPLDASVLRALGLGGSASARP